MVPGAPEVLVNSNFSLQLTNILFTFILLDCIAGLSLCVVVPQGFFMDSKVFLVIMSGKITSITLDVSQCHSAEKNEKCWIEELERIKLNGMEDDYKENCDCK